MIAPMIARPSTVYRLTVTLFRSDGPDKNIDLRASISSPKGNEITFASGKATVGHSTELMMKVSFISILYETFLLHAIVRIINHGFRLSKKKNCHLRQSCSVSGLV